jgi:hypothetical protein
MTTSCFSGWAALLVFAAAEGGCGSRSHDGLTGADADADADVCDGDCPAAGAVRCSADVIETCAVAEDGCLHWGLREDCSSTESVCSRLADDAVCVDCDRGVLDGDYTISDAASLEALAGYTAVSGDLSIRTTLASLDGLECLREVGAALGLSNCDALTNLDALSGLTSVGGGVYIGSAYSKSKAHGTALLTNLDGLSGLTSIGGDLEIAENYALTNVDGLGGLTSIGGNLVIWENWALTSLDGLGGLVDLVGDLLVGVNVVLPTCEATLLDDRLVALGWLGRSTISNNDDTGVCE